MVLRVPLAAPMCERHGMVHTCGRRSEPLLHTPTMHPIEAAICPFTTDRVLKPKGLAVLGPGVVVAPLLCGAPSSLTVRGMGWAPPPLDKGRASRVGTMLQFPYPFENPAR